MQPEKEHHIALVQKDSMLLGEIYVGNILKLVHSEKPQPKPEAPDHFLCFSSM